MFGHDQLDIFVDSKLDRFVAVRVEWQLCPFRWLESGVCGTSIIILCYAAEASSPLNLTERDKFHLASICNLIKKFSLVAFSTSIY